MWYRILLGTMVYGIGVGILTWWLGGLFQRQRPTLGLPIEQLHAARES